MRPRRVSLRFGFVLGLIGALFIAATANAAPPTRLIQGSVTPSLGTPTTQFAFSVEYRGSATDTAVSVTATATSGSTTRTVSMSTTEPLDSGTWTGTSTLPAGTWTVTFDAVTSAQSTATTTAPNPVVVTAPTATPVPTSPPTQTPTPPSTPRPTPRPTSTPGTSTPAPGTTATPVALPTPFGTTVTNPSGSPSEPGGQSSGPGESGSLSPSPAATPPGSRPFNVPAEGVVAIGLLGTVAVAAALGERRRRRAVEAFRAAQASLDERAPQNAGLESGWERDEVRDETVATIDYEGLDDPGQDR